MSSAIAAVLLQYGLDSQGKDCIESLVPDSDFPSVLVIPAWELTLTHVRRGKTMTAKCLCPNLVIWNMVVDFSQLWLGYFFMVVSQF